MTLTERPPPTEGFNSRAREGRDRRSGRWGSAPRCFNSRAREGRDCFAAA